MIGNACLRRRMVQALLVHALFSVLDAASTLMGLTMFEHVEEANIIVAPIVDAFSPWLGMAVYLVIMGVVGLFAYLGHAVLGRHPGLHVLVLSFPLSGLWMINLVRVSVVLGNLGHIYGVSALIPGRYDRLILYTVGYVYGRALYRVCRDSSRLSIWFLASLGDQSKRGA
jgi:hypothetical protein